MAKKSKQNVVVEKFARICWNTKGWAEPSGREGKSSNTDIFEGLFGFGFEEWLLDQNVVIGDFRYAFLQQFNPGGIMNKRENQTFTIHLFTLSPYKWGNGERIALYVGKINNVVVIDDIEQTKVFNHFLSKLRLSRMYNQVYRVNGTWSRNGLLNTRPEDVFNIKFDPNDVIFKNVQKILAPRFIKSYWYKLLDYKEPIYAKDKNGKEIIVDIKTMDEKKWQDIIDQVDITQYNYESDKPI